VGRGKNRGCDNSGEDFRGLIWARRGQRPGVPLLPRLVDNFLWRWRIFSTGWSFSGRPPDGRYTGVSVDLEAAAPKDGLHWRHDGRAALQW
jgi:hypothetical protein